MKMITSMNNTVAFLKSLEKLNDQKKTTTISTKYTNRSNRNCLDTV